MSQESILREARSAIHLQNSKKVLDILRSKDEVPNTDTVSQILDSASQYKLWDVINEICLLEGDNQPTQAAVDKVVERAEVGNDLERIAFLCERSKVKPSVKIIEKKLHTAISLQNLRAIEYFCFLGNECKPGQEAIDNAFVASSQWADKSNLFQKMCAMEGDNKPSINGVNAAITAQHVKHNLELIKLIFTTCKTLPNQKTIDAVLGSACNNQNWDIIEYLYLLPPEHAPSQTAIDNALLTAVGTEKIDHIQAICSMKTANKPSQQTINAAFEHQKVRFNKEMVAFMCEESATKPGRSAIERVLKSVSNQQNWDIVAYLCALTSDNKPCQAAISDVLIALPGANQFELLKTLCRMQGNNQPSLNAVNNVFLNQNIKYNLKMIKFMCEKSETKPTQAAIESVLKSASYQLDWNIVAYLCALTSDNKPSQTTISTVLIALAGTDQFELFKTLCRMQDNNQPSLDAINEAFKHHNIKYNLEKIKFMCEESVTKPSRAAIESVLKSVVYQQDWNIVAYLCALTSDNKPSQAAISDVLIALPGANQFELLKTLCRMQGDNQPSLEAINEAFKHQNIKYNLEMIKFMCEKSETKPTQAAIESVLKSAGYQLDWNIVAYLCALTSDNKPSQAAISDVLITLAGTDQFELFKTLCRMQDNNQPSLDAINEAFKHHNIKYNLEMIKFMCEESVTKPSQAAIESVLKSACYQQKIDIIEYLCLLTSKNKPSSAAIGEALQTAAASQKPDTFLKLCFMQGDNKPNAASIETGLMCAAMHDKTDRITQICEMDDERRPDSEGVSRVFIAAAKGNALNAVKLLANMTAQNKPTPKSYLEAACEAATTNAIHVIKYFCHENKTVTVDQAFVGQLLIAAAASFKAMEVIKYLFSENITIRPNQKDMTEGLLKAATNRNTALVKYFVDPVNKFEFDQALIEYKLISAAGATRGGGLSTVLSLVEMKPRLVSDASIKLASAAAAESNNLDVVMALSMVVAPTEQEPARIQMPAHAHTPAPIQVSTPSQTKPAFTTFTPAQHATPAKSPQRICNENLIKKLTAYIQRIEDSRNADGSIDYTAGFWFFWNARAENRRANYNLARYLRNKLEASPDRDISELFKDIKIEKKREKCTPGITKNAWVKGINSSDLNEIINDAKAFIDENKRHTR